jgi:outer membrane protein insertion porin family
MKSWRLLLCIVAAGMSFFLSTNCQALTEATFALFPLQTLGKDDEVEDARALLEKVLLARLRSEKVLHVIYQSEVEPPEVGFTSRQILQMASQQGAHWAMWGTLTKVGDLWSLDLRLIKVEEGAQVEPFFIQASNREELLDGTEVEMDKILSRILVRKKVIQVRVEGNKRVSKDAILIRVKTRAGQPYSPSQIRRDVKAINKLGFFEDVKVRIEDRAEGKVVTFLIKEKPTIREIVIVGNEKVKTKDIEGVLTLQPQSILNYKALQDNLNKIQELYKQKGFYNAQITYELKDLEGNQKGVVFRINEGRKFYVKKIEFRGNEHFHDKELRKVMATKQRGFLSWITGSGVLDPETLRQDIERIAAFYYNHGFLKVKVSKPKIRTDEKWIYITIQIEEGDPYKVSSFRLQGDLLKDEETLKRKLGTKVGEYFNRAQLRRDIMKLSEIYADMGYAYTEVEPQTRIDDRAKTVDITLDIRKNQKVYIGRIRIMGNTKTRDKVIRRELALNEGDVFSHTKLKESQKNLQALKYFEEVNITTTPGEVESKVDLNVEVKEKQTGTFSVGAGYSSVDKLVGVAQISQRNLFGRGYYVDLRLELGTERQFYQIRLMDPWFMDTRVAMEVIAYNTEREYLDYTRGATGGSIISYFPMGRFFKHLSGKVGYLIEDVEVTDVDKDAATIFQEWEIMGRTVTSEIVAGLSIDTRDERLYPNKGILTTLQVEFAGLGGDNYFGKYILSSSYYHPLYRDLVFHARGEIGYAHGWAGEKLPVFERFFLGGLNSMRGFQPGSVGPRDPKTQDVIGGDKELFFNFEFIFPLVRQLDLRGVIFYDTGNAYLGPIDIADFRHSVGGGIRWNSPFGPIRIEIGYNLDPLSGEKDYEWAFGMGGTF